MFMGEGMQQDLPPGVLLLSRIKRHIKEELQHLPNVTCLETVQREFQPARGKARHLDTIRLEILSDGKQELYASPGDAGLRRITRSLMPAAVSSATGCSVCISRTSC